MWFAHWVISASWYYLIKRQKLTHGSQIQFDDSSWLSHIWRGGRIFGFLATIAICRMSLVIWSPNAIIRLIRSNDWKKKLCRRNEPRKKKFSRFLWQMVSSMVTVLFWLLSLLFVYFWKPRLRERERSCCADAIVAWILSNYYTRYLFFDAQVLPPWSLNNHGSSEGLDAWTTSIFYYVATTIFPGDQAKIPKRALEVKVILKQLGTTFKD